jgi:hypothetical protein
LIILWWNFKLLCVIILLCMWTYYWFNLHPISISGPFLHHLQSSTILILIFYILGEIIECTLRHCLALYNHGKMIGIMSMCYIFHTIVLLWVRDSEDLLPSTAQMLGTHFCGVLLFRIRYTRQLPYLPCLCSDSTKMSYF